MSLDGIALFLNQSMKFSCTRQNISLLLGWTLDYQSKTSALYILFAAAKIQLSKRLRGWLVVNPGCWSMYSNKFWNYELFCVSSFFLSSQTPDFAYSCHSYSVFSIWFGPAELCFTLFLKFAFSNTLLCMAINVLLGRFMILSLIRMNWFPCRGFVKKSPSMSCVGQKATSTSPFLILSVSKKYFMSKCHVHLLLDPLPFSASSMVLLMSCCMLGTSGMIYPCAVKKCHVQSTWPIVCFRRAIFVQFLLAWSWVCSTFSEWHNYATMTVHVRMHCVSAVYPPVQVPIQI